MANRLRKYSSEPREVWVAKVAVGKDESFEKGTTGVERGRPIVDGGSTLENARDRRNGHSS